jgi:L-seryl-tRNA(Ser) seleniumtransferase
VKQIADLTTLTTELDDDESYAGGGALPVSALATCVVRLRVSGMSAAMLASRLREVDPPVIARIADDAVCLDLRTVAPQELRELAAAIRQAAS